MPKSESEPAYLVGDIYLARLKWRKCTDFRPCVVIGAPKDGKVRVVPISSALELRNIRKDFLIEDTDIDFKATGLKKTSFASDEIQEVPLREFGPKWGRLEGDLAKRFWDWLG